MEFPFDVYDVAEYIGLELKRQHPKSADYNCPFCGGKGKMNLNVERNTFRCNKCGVSGGMLDLFTKCTNVSDKKEAYHILAEKHSYAFAVVQRQKRREAVKAVNEVQRADADRLDYVYRALLNELSLEPKHRENLLSRGLSEEIIRQLQYRSVPQKGFDYLIRRLLECGCNLIGVPGFYVSDNGEIKVNIYDCMVGIFIPVYSAEGKIQGLQIRLDKPFDNKCKYMWFSSAEKNGGCSSNSPVQVCGDVFESPVVYITEGPLKCQIAHFLSGKPFVSVAGVNQTKELAVFLQELRKKGKCRLIIDAFDMDDNKNEHVRRGHQNLIFLSQKYGFVPKRIIWDRQYKGIDDYLYAKKGAKNNV